MRDSLIEALEALKLELQTNPGNLQDVIATLDESIAMAKAGEMVKSLDLISFNLE